MQQRLCQYSNCHRETTRLVINMDHQRAAFCSYTHAIWWLLAKVRGLNEVTEVDEFRKDDPMRKLEIGRPYRDSLL